MRAMILVGGEGTRLRPLTLSRPKALMPIVGRPLLEWMLMWLKQYGVRKILLSVCYKPDPIKRVFGSGKGMGLSIEYVHESQPLGTGGAIRRAANFIEGTTLVLNGDVLMDVDLGRLAAFHRSKGSLATITLVPVEDPTAYGLVRTDRRDRVLQFLEKPSMDEADKESYISAGCYMLEPEAVAEIPSATPCSVEREVFPKFLHEEIPFFAYRARPGGYWMDVGTPQRFRMVQDDMLRGRLKVAIPGRKIRPGVWVHPEAKVGEGVTLGSAVYIGKAAWIHDQAHIGDGTVIGEGVVMHSGSTVAASIIFDGAVIGRGARIVNSIVGPRVDIGEHAVVEGDALLGEGTRISSYSRM